MFAVSASERIDAICTIVVDESKCVLLRLPTNAPVESVEICVRVLVFVYWIDKEQIPIDFLFGPERAGRTRPFQKVRERVPQEEGAIWEEGCTLELSLGQGHYVSFGGPLAPGPGGIAPAACTCKTVFARATNFQSSVVRSSLKCSFRASMLFRVMCE